MISDGRGERAPLDYAIDACSRQGAMIDLLVHGVVDPTSISALENRIRAADLDCHRIQLGMNPGDDIVDYIRSQPSLIFLVASSDDDVAKVLIVDVIPRRGRRVPVPLVLIEDRSFARSAKKSAA